MKSTDTQLALHEQRIEALERLLPEIRSAIQSIGKTNDSPNKQH